MKTIPIICTLALTVMTAFFVKAWWPIRDMGCDFRAIQPRTFASIAVPVVPRIEIKQPAPASAPAAVVTKPEQTPPDAESVSIDKKTLDSLVAEIQRLGKSNETLRDQLAELNRDLMQLEFRVDTHSESFRPLPVNEEQIATTSEEPIEEEASLLPPLIN
jgi:hypothetical protein